MTVRCCKCPSLRQCSKGLSVNALVGGTGVRHGRLCRQVEQLYLKSERSQLWRRMKCSHFTNSGLVMWGLKEKVGSKKRLFFFSGKKGGRRTQNGGERERQKMVSGQAQREGSSRGGLVSTVRALTRLLRGTGT